MSGIGPVPFLCLSKDPISVKGWQYNWEIVHNRDIFAVREGEWKMKPKIYVTYPIQAEVEAFLSEHCDIRQWQGDGRVPRERRIIYWW